MSATLNIIKDAYLTAVTWIDVHPHKTFWLALGAIILARVI